MIFSFLLFILINSILLFASDFFYYKKLKDKIESRFLAVSTLFFLLIFINISVLGFLSILYLPITLLSVVLSSSVLILLTKPKKEDISIYKSFFLNYLSLYWNFIKSISLLSKFFITLFAFVILFLIFVGLVFPILDWDGLSYHMTFVGNAIQYHSILDQPTPTKWLNGYPKAGEFFQLWNTFFLKDDIIADLTQLPFLFMAITALYHITKTLGAKKEYAFVSALTFGFIPVVIAQAKTTYVEIMIASLFFSGIYFLMKSKNSNVNLLFSGFVFGLLFATKATGLLFIFVAFGFFAAIALKENGIKKTIVRSSWFLLPVLIIGAPWYLKNLFLYGTPLYPFGFKIMGYPIFPGKTFGEFSAAAVNGLPGFPSGYLDRIFYTWTEQKDWYGCLYNYDSNFSGLGPLWFIVMVPSIIFSLTYALFKKNKTFIFIALLFITLFLIHPNNYYPRYTIFFTGIGTISLGYSLSFLKNNFQKITLLIVAIISFITVFVSLNQCYYNPINLRDQLKTDFIKNDRPLLYDKMFGKVFGFLENNVKKGETVVYDSSPMFIYPLWKQDFSNKVLYIDEKDDKIWLQKVLDGNYEYIYTRIGSRENEILRNQDILQAAYKDEQYEVYKRK